MHLIKPATTAPDPDPGSLTTTPPAFYLNSCSPTGRWSPSIILSKVSQRVALEITVLALKVDTRHGRGGGTAVRKGMGYAALLSGEQNKMRATSTASQSLTKEG